MKNLYFLLGGAKKTPEYSGVFFRIFVTNIGFSYLFEGQGPHFIRGPRHSNYLRYLRQTVIGEKKLDIFVCFSVFYPG
jgi:hypothetical protein